MSIQIRYENLRAETMPVEVLTACSELFSSSYGTYDPKSPNRPGERIRMGVGQYRKRYCKKGFFLARALDGDKQVAHAIYIRKRYEPYGMITWVVQLVVDSKYRRKGIASTLLRSIWGLSDDFAWGLASANPCTVKTLESATFRRCDAAFVQKNIDAVRAIGADTGFVSDDAYDVGKNRSMVNTHFYADNSEYKEDVDCSRYLGDLPLGYEWLAFTFREQSISRDAFSRHFTRMMNGYDNILRDAYSRMNMSEHPWTKGTDAEVTFIEAVCKGNRILDLGCGTGRHAIELAKRGYEVVAVDNADRHIEEAKKKAQKIEGISFINADARSYRDPEKYDTVLCLFDVVGSYPNMMDNRRILKTAYKHLETGGSIVLSVMNLELTESLIPDSRKAKLSRRPDILENLLPGNIMQRSGQIFDPAYLAMDTEKGLIYRKEQFVNDSGLPAEYIIRDKRFRKNEIIEIIREVGFTQISAVYVQAGHFDVHLKATDPKAKEILVIAKKGD